LLFLLASLSIVYVLRSASHMYNNPGYLHTPLKEQLVVPASLLKYRLCTSIGLPYVQQPWVSPYSPPSSNNLIHIIMPCLGRMSGSLLFSIYHNPAFVAADGHPSCIGIVMFCLQSFA